MSRLSATILIILAAIIGALTGGFIVYGALGNSLRAEIETRLASAGASAQAIGGIDDVLSGTGVSSSTASGSGTTLLDPEEIAVTEVYRSVSPSVVHVSTIRYYRSFFFFQVVPQEGTGSGFIISDDGYVLTNNHVIAGAHEITVRMSNGDEYAAELVGTDQMTDIAVLHIEDADIPPDWVAPLGDSDSIQVGQRAIAIGNPFGLDSTVTVGVISALDRPVSTEDTTLENMIQTDASINPGNSGGPLISSSGHVIGINTVILSQSGGSHGIGFAIPINSARRVAADLIEYGRVRRPSLGFNGLTLTHDLADVLGLPVDYGVLVQEVERGSAAWDAGLRGGTNRVVLRDRFRQFALYDDGDVIVEFEGEKVTDFSYLADRIRRMELGEEVTLKVIRQGREIELTMVLRE